MDELFGKETKQRLRIDTYTSNYMLKVLEKDLSYWTQIGLEDFDYSPDEHKLVAKALYNLYEDGFKGFEDPREFMLNATTGKYTTQQKDLMASQMFEVSLTLEKFIKEENFDIYVKNFREEVKGFKEGLRIAPNPAFLEFGTSLLDRLPQIELQVNKLKEQEVELGYYPFKIAPQTVNTLVATTNVGKSTLAAAMLQELSKDGKACLLSTEESENDIGSKLMRMNKINLKNMNILVRYELNEKMIVDLFTELEKFGYKYLIVDYVNPHNIMIEADLAAKIDQFYQWLIEGAQRCNIAVFAFIQANRAAYSDKIDIVQILTDQPNKLSNFTDGGIRAIVKSYSAVFLHKESDYSRMMIPCKGRSDDAQERYKTILYYDVDLTNYSITLGKGLQDILNTPIVKDDKKEPKTYKRKEI